MSMVNVAGKNATTKLSNIDDDMIQPNAVDLRVEKFLKILPTPFKMSQDNTKTLRKTEEVIPDENGYFHLDVGDYEVVAENDVSVGEDEAGLIIVRSSYNRSGLFLSSGVFDSGYNGKVIFVLHNEVGPAEIQKGSRIGQYLSWKAESLKQYNGSYGFGTNDDIKYGKKNL